MNTPANLGCRAPGFAFVFHYNQQVNIGVFCRPAMRIRAEQQNPIRMKLVCNPTAEILYFSQCRHVRKIIRIHDLCN